MPPTTESEQSKAFVQGPGAEDSDDGMNTSPQISRASKAMRTSSPLHQQMPGSFHTQSEIPKLPDYKEKDKKGDDTPATLAGIAKLLQPMQASIDQLSTNMSQMNIQMNARMQEVETRMNSSEDRFEKLLKSCWLIFFMDNIDAYIGNISHLFGSIILDLEF